MKTTKTKRKILRDYFDQTASKNEVYTQALCCFIDETFMDRQTSLDFKSFLRDNDIICPDFSIYREFFLKGEKREACLIFRLMVLDAFLTEQGIK